jgi:hypothetical protein
MTGFDGPCTTVEIGGPVQYAWHTWPDKIVRKVAIMFYIGC